MRDSDFHSDLLDELLKLRFEQIGTATVATPSITQRQDARRVGVGVLSLLNPPVSYAVTGKLAGILTRPKRDVPYVLLEVIDPIGNHHPIRKTVEIMVKRLNPSLGIQMSFPVIVAKIFFLFGIYNPSCDLKKKVAFSDKFPLVSLLKPIDLVRDFHI